MRNKTKINIRLEKLNDDYYENKGQYFDYFFCPILFKDEDVEVCKAHIINQAFPSSSRRWTIQRKDIDGFYGSYFESDFVSIQYKEIGSIADTVTDKKLSRVFKPKILLDGNQIDFFIARGDIPTSYTRIEFDNDGDIVPVALKMSSDEVHASLNQDWEISVSKDVRICAIVSLIKSSHLTLFKILGYSYAFSATGYFIGRDILGKFYLQNKDNSKGDLLKNASLFFREFANMVRPLQHSNIGINGTTADNYVLVCRGRNNQIWAMIVFIKTSQSMHAVLMPVFDNPEMVETYLSFLQNENEQLYVSWCQYKEGHWSIDKNIDRFIWPKKGILYPED